MALVGCPDRRIDRLCITCCLPSQLSLHTEGTARTALRGERDWFFVILTLRQHRPCHSRELIGQRDGRNLGWAPGEQRREPRPMLGAVDFRVANDRERAGGEQAAQIAVTLFADTAKLVFASARVLLRHEPDPGREVSS